ncbi:diacylglycerol/lipid kinase family protein [Jatrophihabitans sp. DSM 45814]
MNSIAVVFNPTKVDELGALKSAIAERSIAAGHGEPLWLETTSVDPGAGMVASALADGAELIVCCGGDGTVAACAGALAEARSTVALAIVPMGTGNLLARNLALPLNLTPALDVAFGAGRTELDVLKAGDRSFVVMAGLGFDAALIRDTSDGLKAKIGWLAYLGGLVRATRSPRVWFELRVDEQPVLRRRAVGVLIGNVGRVQGDVAILPDAKPDDGLADVLVLRPRRLRDWPVLLWRLLRGSPDSGEQADIVRGVHVSVRADRDVPVEYDGDFAGTVRQMDVQVLPGAVLLCVPE